MKFLVIQTASIGDVILATALIEKLHDTYPDAEIDFLIKKGYENLFSSHPFLNELIVWNKKNDKYRNLFQILKRIRGRKYDAVVNVQRFAATGLLTAFSKAKMKIGFDKNPFSYFFNKKVKHIIGDGRHEVQRNQELIADITDGVPAKPRLYPTEQDFDNVKQFKTREYICIAPCSLWFTKQMPEEQWTKFAASLPKGLKVFLLGGKDDNDICERIRIRSGNEDITNLSGQLSLLRSAALMRDAKMNFVNDSSPMHLAASQDAPTTAVFCSTTTDFGFGPLSSDSRVVETREKLECRPCGLHGFKQCPKGHFKCGYTIDLQKLTERL